MMKIMSVFGTRPEAIKMAPLLKCLTKDPVVTSIVVTTGQHREMLQQVLNDFAITPDFDLAIMKKNQTLAEITTAVLTKLTPLLIERKPDCVLVHGDTTTTMAASLAAFYQQIPIGHVEAGLRTWDKYSPFPEEANRQITDTIADFYFAPTERARHNLLISHCAPEKIFVTGNTVIDALHYTVKPDYHHDLLAKLPKEHRMILLTMHRRESQGAVMEKAFQAIRQTVDQNPDVEVIYPVHLNPNVQKAAHEILQGHPRIHLIAPLDMVDFHNFMARCYFIMTDSGGVQEEAAALNKPVLVLRNETERISGVKTGSLKLVGVAPKAIQNAMNELLHDPIEYANMCQAKNPYGDGSASQKIDHILRRSLKK